MYMRMYRKFMNWPQKCSSVMFWLKLTNPLYSGNPLTSTFANSEDPDEMQHNAAFHQGLHCL